MTKLNINKFDLNKPLHPIDLYKNQHIFDTNILLSDKIDIFDVWRILHDSLRTNSITISIRKFEIYFFENI